MVEQSDRAPLLDWEEEVGRAEPSPAMPAPHSGGFPATEPADRCPPSNSGANNGWSASPGGARSVTAVKGRGRSTRPGPEGDAYASGTDEEGDCAFPGPCITSRAAPGWEEKDQIVAVFVVTFDTRSGERGGVGGGGCLMMGLLPIRAEDVCTGPSLGPTHEK